MSRSMRQARLAGAALLVVAAAVPPAVAADSAAAGGRAASSGTLFRLAIGDRAVELGVDDLAADHRSEATAALILGRSGDEEVGKASSKRTASGKDQQTLGTGPTSLGDVVALNVAGGTARVEIDGSAETRSAVTTSLSDATLAKAARVLAVEQAAESAAGPSASKSKRILEIADLTLLRVRDLLDAVDVGLLSLACGQVEDLAAELGAPGADACTRLSAVNQAVAASGDVLGSAKNGAVDLRAATLAAIAVQEDLVTQLEETAAGLQATRAELTAQVQGTTRQAVEATIADLDAEIAALAPGCTTLGLLCDVVASLQAERAAATAQLQVFDEIEAVTAELDQVAADMSAVTDLLDELGVTLAEATSILDALAKIDLGGLPTCAEATGALKAAAAVVPEIGTTASAASEAVSDACSILSETLDGILDTPVLSIEGVELTIETVARRDFADATISGSLGTVRVGALDPVGVDVPVGAATDTLETVSDGVRTSLEGVFDALGFAGTKVELTLFEVDRTSHVAPNGASSATAALRLLDLKVPSVTLAMPAAAPFGAVAGQVPGAAETPGEVTTSGLALRVASFDSSAVFPAASRIGGGGGGGGGRTGGSLPVTGVDSRMDIALALLLTALVADRLRRRSQANAA